MRTSLGISAGTDVVCSALVTTAPNDAQSFDYRIVSADAGHPDLGDLVASSIELMTTQLPATHLPREGNHLVGARFAGGPRDDTAASTAPTGVAVAYRGKEQEQAIRSATGRQRELRLVPETTAALTYLHFTGLLDRYQTVAVVDLGASGLTVTVADQQSGEVLRSERTNAISGKAIDDLIYHHLVDQHYARRGTRPNRTVLINRGRAAKEHLSIAPAVTIDHVAGQPLKLTRVEFEKLIAGPLHDAAAFTAAVFATAPTLPDAVAVIGGGANIPAVFDTLTRELDIPVFTVPEPDAVIAKGAALVADSMQPTTLPVTAGGGDAPAGTFTKVVGTLAGAIVVVGLIIGYGVKTFAPTSDTEVSPAGTTSGAAQPQHPQPVVVPPSWTGTITTEHSRPTTTVHRPNSGAAASATQDQDEPSTTEPTTTTTTTTTETSASPTLRPDPNLPSIPFPELLGPLLGNTPTSQPPSSEPNQAPSGTTTPNAESTPESGTPSSSAPTQTSAGSRVPSPPRPDSGSSQR